MSKNILITGGAGFIGRHLCDALLRDGHFVTVVDNLTPQVHGDAPEIGYLGAVRFHRCDVGNVDGYASAILDAEIIIHLAAQTGTGQSMYKIADYFDSNVRDTSLLVEFMAQHSQKLEKVIVASSRAIYGEGAYLCASHGKVYPRERDLNLVSGGDFSVRCPVCASNVELLTTDEECPSQPTSYYGLTKQIQEQLVLMLAKNIGIDGYAFRFQNVIGEFQSLRNPYTGILAVFSNLARDGKAIDVFEDGNESRDFVHVSDVVRSIVAAIYNHSHFIGPLNVGSGVSTSVLEVARAINSYYGNRSSIKVTGQFRVGDIRHNIADLKKINDVLGFQPKVDFREGLTRFLNWASSQDDLGGEAYAQSIRELEEFKLLVGRKPK
jgi:dTDP-L-rhamnose 4-epimerase